MEFKQVFIIGAPRSGTTFLASLLEFTEFGTPPETHFIIKNYNVKTTNSDLSDKKEFTKLIKKISSERAVQQWKISLDPNQLYKLAHPNFSYANICNYIMAQYKKEKTEECAWGDKTPVYTKDLDKLYEIFPDAKYLYIYRDGRDVSLSLLKKDWGPNNIYECAKLWRNLNNNDHILEKIKNDGNLFTIKYEDLLTSSERIIEEVYSFLDQTITEEQKKSLSLSTNISNSKKWKSNMSNRDVNTFEAVAGTTLKKLGYEVKNPSAKLKTLEKFKYKAHGLIKRAIFLFKVNVIDGIKIKLSLKEPFNE